MQQQDWLARNLILITGKGGVGKTTVAEATARHLASLGKRTLLCHVLQLEEQPQELERLAPNLWSITLNASECFKEYIIMKLRVKTLYSAFLGNKVTQYLERAAPGVREIVLLGKVWHERLNYEHVVVDMPSTGYALTMIHTPFNFAALFPGGPVYRDSQEMIDTFSDATKTAFVTVSLAEEMPIQESVELAENFREKMPRNPSFLVLNRLVRVSPGARAMHEGLSGKLSDAQKNNPLVRGLAHLISRENKQRELLEQLRRAKPPFGGDWLEIEEVELKDDRQRGQVIAGLLKTKEPRHG